MIQTRKGNGWGLVRKSLCARYGGHCSYCNTYVGMRGTVDHYLPEALGGSDEPHNLRWACEPCNNLKADMHPDAWEQVKPPPVRVRTRLQIKIDLLSSIAQRNYRRNSR